VARTYLSFLFIVSLLSILGCGGGTGRMLLSVAITPSSATASGGNVQFTATGTYNTEPKAVTPLAAQWTVDRPFFSLLPDSGHVIVDNNGLAHCAPGFTGVSTIFAGAPVDPSQPVTMQNFIEGIAQLTCP
jgi:hypothetical protein